MCMTHIKIYLLTHTMDTQLATHTLFSPSIHSHLSTCWSGIHLWLFGNEWGHSSWCFKEFPLLLSLQTLKLVSSCL